MTVLLDFMEEQIKKLMAECAAKLGEHCGTVLILATVSECDDKGHFTDGYSEGVGDFYSRIGMATIYLEKNKAIARARAAASDAQI